MGQEQILEQLERAYDDISTLLTKVNEIDDIANKLDNIVKTFSKSYKEIFDTKKLSTFEKENKGVIQQIETDSNKISSSLQQLEYYRESVSSDISRFNQRISNYEEDIKKLKSSVNDVDNKLNRIVKEAEKKRYQSSKDVKTAFKLLQANGELENFDELLKVQQENNKLLKELNKKIKPYKPYNKQKNNQVPFPKKNPVKVLANNDTN